MREFLDATRACGNLGSVRRWLTMRGLETPAPTVDNLARQSRRAPVASARLHSQAAGDARQGCRRRARRGRGDGEGVVLAEAEDHDDVPVTMDDSEDEVVYEEDGEEDKDAAPKVQQVDHLFRVWGLGFGVWGLGFRF